MKFSVEIRDKGSRESHVETYDVNTSDPEAWAKGTMDYFNSTLHPGEKEREVVSVSILEKYSLKDHKWEKQNLVTISDQGDLHDAMKCKVCGITAKRYGLSTIVYDKRFNKKVFCRCDTSMAYFGKLLPGEKLPLRGRRKGQA